MVINDFNVIGATFLPTEADAPLMVDPDTVAALAVTLQRFQPVCGWDPQVFQNRRAVEHAELAPGNLLDVDGQSPGSSAAPDLFRFLVGKVADHGEL